MFLQFVRFESGVKTVSPAKLSALSFSLIIVANLAITSANAAAKIKDRSSPANTCDEMAASPFDDLRPEGIKGVQLNDVVYHLALGPCEAAVKAEPDNMRLVAQLARVLDRYNTEENNKRELELNLKAAEAGYTLAMMNLGVQYNLGIGTAINKDEAFKWFMAAASPPHTHRKALHDVGTMYAEGTGAPLDNVKAGTYFCRSAEAGFVQAYRRCGDVHANGYGVLVDKPKAFLWYQRGALGEDAAAQAELAGSYYYGTVSEVSNDLAFFWATRSAAGNNAKGRRLLGDLYDQGNGVAIDRIHAQGLYLLAAEAGDAEAMSRLADSYYTGAVIPKNYDLSLHWAKLATDKGSESGMVNLGLLYDFGYGIEKDDVKAAELYRKAAEMGDMTGMNNYGEMLFAGQGTAVDVTSAMQWLQKSSDAGSSYGSHNMAMHIELEEGGLTYDAAKVARNLLLALSRDHYDTRKILLEFKGNELKATTLDMLQELMAKDGKDFVQTPGKLSASAVIALQSYLP